jgi:hypothetical protein
MCKSSSYKGFLWTLNISFSAFRADRGRSWIRAPMIGIPPLGKGPFSAFFPPDHPRQQPLSAPKPENRQKHLPIMAHRALKGLKVMDRPLEVEAHPSVRYRQKKNLPTSWIARPGCGSALRSAVVEPVTEVTTPKNPGPSV